VLGAKAANQDYEYVPLVRENVKWECFYWGNLDEKMIKTTYSTPRLYTYEIKGDTVVNGVTYQKCYRYNNSQNKVLNTQSDTIAALLREENKVVYCRDNEVWARDRIFGVEFGTVDEFKEKGPNEDEYVLYDFNYDKMYQTMQSYMTDAEVDVDTLIINGTTRMKYSNKGFNWGFYLEGIGWVSKYEGEMISEYRPLLLSIPYDYRGLVRVIEGNDTVFEGPALDEYNYWLRTGAVNEVSVNNPNTDDRYYDLMGMPVEHPTSGIYIHNGKKVIIR